MTDAFLARLAAAAALPPEAVERIAERLAASGGAVDGLLVELRLVPAARLPEVLARASGLPVAPETAFTAPDPRARRVFPAELAGRHAVAPFALSGRELSVVTTCPPDPGTLEELGVLLSLKLVPHVAPAWRVRALVRQLYGAPLPSRTEGPDPSRPPGWTPEEAREALAAAAGPDEAIHVALRAARDVFAFAAAFSVRRDAVAGRDALGADPGAAEACRRVAVDPAAAGLLGGALHASAPYLGPPPSDPVTTSILSALGRGSPGTVLVAPVRVGERTACIVYADDGDAEVDADRTGDLLALLPTLGDALARAIRERKAFAGNPAAAGEASGAEAGSSAPPPAPAALRREGAETWVVREPALLGAGPPRVNAPRASGAPAPEPAEPQARIEDAVVVPGEPAPDASGESVEALLALLASPDPARRRAAVAPLLRLAPPGALAAVAALVQDDDPGVAEEAARGIATVSGTPAAAPALGGIRRALASGRPVRAERAARALGTIGDADAVPDLIRMLDEGGELAVACASALTSITLQDHGGDSRRWIAWWREWRAAPRSSWLLLALESPEPALRRRAATALRRAGDPPEPYDPDAPEPERTHAARAWARWWREEGLAL